MSIYLSVCLSIFLSICLCVCMYVCVLGRRKHFIMLCDSTYPSLDIIILILNVWCFYLFFCCQKLEIVVIASQNSYLKWGTSLLSASGIGFSPAHCQLQRHRYFQCCAVIAVASGMSFSIMSLQLQNFQYYITVAEVSGMFQYYILVVSCSVLYTCSCSIRNMFQYYSKCIWDHGTIFVVRTVLQNIGCAPSQL